ncbi:chaperone protein DnaJ [Dichotomopilus funicola]|uniref:Chaperone protein DnaJ n=1 Tax=Dichotomopilus funicola TaxID=1934379 RepID=A0AAN6UY06_9PEZI|nr:chaperone protein DnaJ [Dichotomopilus funicola]
MSALLSLLGWSFLPGLVTSWTQSLYYSLTIRAGDPRPQPGTPRFAEHRRRIHIAVVTLYLAYTVYEADYELQRAGSFYTDLGVPLSATDRDIKSRFRRLAALHHPDKASSSQAVGGQRREEDINAYFVHLKTAADTLTDPARRFAYERFGPDILSWTRCVTIRDYVVRGAQAALIPYYVTAAVAMYALGLLGYLDWGRYERWLVLAVLFVFETYAVTRPGLPGVLEKVVNPLLGWGVRSGLGGTGRAPYYLPFQAIALARKLSVTVYIAFSQIGPLLAADTRSGQLVMGGNGNNPGNGGGKKGGDDEKALREALDRLDAVVKQVDNDATMLLDTEMVPFSGDQETRGSMWVKAKEWLVQNTIRSDPMVRDALGKSFAKRSVEVPVGVRERGSREPDRGA